MTPFFKKRAARLRPITLFLMLIIPFLAFAAAVSANGFWLAVSLGFMAIDMLVAMITG
jgi:hypothetical protein